MKIVSMVAVRIVNEHNFICAIRDIIFKIIL